MIDDGVRVITFVSFAMGDVERIAYQIPTGVNEFDSVEPRIVVSVRPIAKASCLTALPARLLLLFAYLVIPSLHFAIALDQSQDNALENGLRDVICVLREEGHLTRHQELEAYVAFDIPYSTKL